jgi:serine/threonine protein kinase
MPSDKEVLLQMAQGLEYIHSQVVKGSQDSQTWIYRDVHPTNILISCDNPTVIKWADFGYSREGSQSTTYSKVPGHHNYFAPELTPAGGKKVKGSQSCDVFALGCVFFFYSTQGKHPFNGDTNADPVNITGKKSSLFLFIIYHLFKSKLFFRHHLRVTESTFCF